MNTEVKKHRGSKKSVLLRWGFVVVGGAVIFYMSSNTDTGLNEGLGLASYLLAYLKEIQAQLLGPGVDILSSVAHFCEYAIFGALLVNALRLHVSLRNACLIAVACASVYGVTDEIHQLFVPGRMCDPLDWVVDTVGASLSASLLYLILRKRSANSPQQ